MLVEDEPILRMLVGDFLAELQITVIEAYDVDSAVAALERCPDIRILFTDIDMPGLLDGADLALQAAERWPKLHLFLTTGKRMPALSRMPVGCEFIPKPYDLDKLGERLRAILENE
ncbi:response regulator [Labrys miyagiensis]|uniref:Response regulator n=1 Tax=Labrys miyagiensis TaxID=346912 RepID=A0ABQ6CLY6_9HYPH|nr:response regulator [Labrys miyagiensis]